MSHEQVPSPADGRRDAADPWPVVDGPAGTERVEIADEVVDSAPRRGASFRDAPPRPRWRMALAQLRHAATGLAFLVGLAWLIAPGGFTGGWFAWALLGIIVAPLVLCVGFVVLLGAAWTRSARRVMEEAQRRAGGR